MKILPALAGLSLLLSAGICGAVEKSDPSVYNYPIQDRNLATVIGTPPEFRPDLPTKIRFKRYEVRRFPQREVPRIFWGGNSLHYGVARQKKPAPLAFVIAGTGGSYFDSKVIFLMRALYAAGFHAVGISSPTNPGFITTASQSEIPGLPGADAKDLHAVMQAIQKDLEHRIDVTGWNLVGYSLGATQAAFVAELDSHEKHFDFEQVYLINPSVNVYTSAGIIDGLYREALPDGDASINQLVSTSLGKAIHYLHTSGRSPLGSEFLYRAIADIHPSDVDLEGAIATVFRLASANLSFTADFMSGSGRIVEPGTKLEIGTNMDPYFDASLQWSFVRYFEELLLPFWQDRLNLDKQELIARAGLPYIRDFLSRSENIQVVTNADDLILGPGDLDFLRTTFGERAKIYPFGGHCGNLEFNQNIERMQKVLSRSSARKKP